MKIDRKLVEYAAEKGLKLTPLKAGVVVYGYKLVPKERAKNDSK